MIGGSAIKGALLEQLGYASLGTAIGALLDFSRWTWIR
jgi:hypothetical protein